MSDFSELNREDVVFIVRRLPRDIRVLMAEQANNGFPIFLAGGFIRAVIAGETPNDIDLLAGNIHRFEALAYKFAVDRDGRTHKTDNAITVLSGQRMAPQFITRWQYDDPVQLISEFDLSIAQAVIWCEQDPVLKNQKDSDGVPRVRWKSLCSRKFYEDLASHRLRYTAPHRDEEVGGTMLRIMKFARRGYTMAPEELSKVIARLVTGVHAGDTADNISILDHCGLTEDEFARVLAGLLREVDPATVEFD